VDSGGFQNGEHTLPTNVSRSPLTMDNFLQVELTSHERDILLRGLRYVKSAIMLEVRDPSPEHLQNRSRQLDQVVDLSQRLESTDAMGVHI
jgi:hypothetical protein